MSSLAGHLSLSELSCIACRCISCLTSRPRSSLLQSRTKSSSDRVENVWERRPRREFGECGRFMGRFENGIQLRTFFSFFFSSPSGRPNAYQDVGTHASSDFSKEQVDTQKKQQQFQNEQTLSQCSPFWRHSEQARGQTLPPSYLVPTKTR